MTIEELNDAGMDADEIGDACYRNRKEKESKEWKLIGGMVKRVRSAERKQWN